MSEWREVKISELCDITRGASPRPIQDFLSEEGTPWVKISDATSENSRYISKTKEYIKIEGESKSRIVLPGDFILSNSATPGLPKFMKIRACVHDGWLLLRNLKEVDKIFLYYKLLQEREAILVQGNGSIFTNLKTDILKEHTILLPPLPEQKAIASVLSSLDDKIDLLHSQNETLEKMAETLFRQWFVEEAKDDWEEVKLKEIADIGIGRTPPRKEFQWFSKNPKDIKWVSIKDMGESGIYINQTSECLTKEAVEKFNIPVIPKDTVILSFKMTLGRIGITSEDMLSNEAIAHFKLKEETFITKEYLYLYLKNYKFDSLGSTSSIVTSINSSMIKDMDIIIPDNNSIEKFQKISELNFEKIKINQHQIETLTNLRDTLLPKLMSGEVRVEV